MKAKNSQSPNEYKGMLIGQFKVIGNGLFVVPPKISGSIATSLLMIVLSILQPLIVNNFFVQYVYYLSLINILTTNDAQQIDYNFTIVNIFQYIFLFFTVLFIFSTALTDPGIIPRNTKYILEIRPPFTYLNEQQQWIIKLRKYFIKKEDIINYQQQFLEQNKYQSKKNSIKTQDQFNLKQLETTSQKAIVNSNNKTSDDDSAIQKQKIILDAELYRADISIQNEGGQQKNLESEGSPVKLSKVDSMMLNKKIGTVSSIECNFCETCNIVKTPRVYHCNICDCCISVHDHHCPWIGTCIAQRNKIPFLLYGITVLILALYSFIQNVYILAFAPIGFQFNHPFCFKLQVPSSLLLIASISISSCLMAFTWRNICYASKNQTAQEDLRQKYEFYWGSNVYDYGMCSFKNTRYFWNQQESLIFSKNKEILLMIQNEQNINKVKFEKPISQFYNGIAIYNQHVFDTAFLHHIESDEIYQDFHYYKYFMEIQQQQEQQQQQQKDQFATNNNQSPNSQLNNQLS